METPQTEIIKQTAAVIPFVLKLMVVGGVGFFAYYKFTHQFVKRKEIAKFGQANVTQAQAEARAAAIAASNGWLSDDYEMVASNLAGLNYNGFVRVYNAFGSTTNYWFGADLDMIEWLYSKYSAYEMEQLSMLLNGAFF